MYTPSIETARVIVQIGLRKQVDASLIDKVSANLRGRGRERLAELEGAVIEAPTDILGKVLKRAFLLSFLIREALWRELPEAEAEAVFRQFLHRLLRPIFKLSMWPLPKSNNAFEVFKRRYSKANKPLTLMKWDVAEDTPTTFQADFSHCGYATMARDLGDREFCKHFCAYDEVFFGAYHPQLVFIREQTLARGDDCCTFRFEWRETGD